MKGEHLRGVELDIESMIKYCLSKLMSEFIITYNVFEFFSTENSCFLLNTI